MTNISDVYSLSPVQQGLLFHSLYEPDSAAYFNQLGCRIEGALDLNVLRQAVDEVARRHAILRTGFYWQNLKQPLQAVYESVEVPWAVEDWSDIPTEERERKWTGFLAADRLRGFDLSKPPLLRIAVFGLGNRDCYFCWSNHHIIMDGWCREVLIQEVFSTYQAYARGEAPALNQTHDYRSYIEWMQAQDPAKAESFWREELGGVDSATRISIERPNSAGEGKHGECRLTLRPEVTEKIEHFARQQRVTVNSVVQAGWALLLGRYSGTRDIIFGATVSGRSVPVAGVAMMMGLFINTLPVRVKLKGELTTGDFVRDLQNRQTQARQYEYSSLVEVQRCCDIPSGQPLFENILVFDRKPINDATLSRASGGLCFSGVRVHDVSHYPLMLSASYSGGSISRFITVWKLTRSKTPSGC